MASIAVAKLVKRSEHEDEEIDWIKIAAGGSLVAGGLLVLTGNRKSGLAAAAAGTALALLDQQSVIRKWWNQMPAYVDQLQGILGKVREAVDEVASKREALREALKQD
ncbi:MAG TPA: hypothetical protein VG844_06720 [Terracidiphilus sp.]|nr:hypothetical protein [Terracidiphilus sp.]